MDNNDNQQPYARRERVRSYSIHEWGIAIKKVVESVSDDQSSYMKALSAFGLLEIEASDEKIAERTKVDLEVVKKLRIGLQDMLDYEYNIDCKRKY